jgi:DNA integrity scanning protein DisA with diadenylate cyclase activity
MKPEIEKETSKLSLIAKNHKAKPASKNAKKRETEWTNLIIKQAISMAKKIEANAILFYMDSTEDFGPFLKINGNIKLILLTKKRECFEMASDLPVHTVMIPDVQLTRVGYLKIGFLTAISKGFLTSGDVVVCVGGLPEQGYVDTIMLVEAGSESELFGGGEGISFHPDIRSEVFETLLGIVLELANEGREGKPIGSIFVLGDHKKVLSMSHQLVFNPFHGHPEESLNLNDPQVRESLKEFSSIDGAFIIRDDGIVLAAGRYLNVGYHGEALPQGLGARHAASAAITQMTGALSLTISESTGTVTVFSGGKILTEIEKASIPTASRTVPL